MHAAVSNELAATNMASSSSGSTLEGILADRHLFESQVGISYAEVSRVNHSISGIICYFGLIN